MHLYKLTVKLQMLFDTALQVEACAVMQFVPIQPAVRMKMCAAPLSSGTVWEGKVRGSYFRLKAVTMFWHDAQSKGEIGNP